MKFSQRRRSPQRQQFGAPGSDQILNPKTGRYVSRTGKIGKKILENMKSSPIKSKSYKTQGKKGPRKDTKYLKNKFSFGTTLEDMPEELIYTIASQTGPEEANFFTKMDILKKIPMLQLLI